MARLNDRPRSWKSPALILVVLLAACGMPETDSSTGGGGGTLTRIPIDAPSGRTVIRTTEGLVEVGYDVVGGRALMEGDIDLGPAESLPPPGRVRKGNVELFGGRWPGGVVYYYLGVVLDQEALIRQAIAEVDAATDLAFIELAAPVSGMNYIYFTYSFDTSSSHVGMQGGRQYLRLSLDTLINGRAWIKETVKHELGHAIGLWHEQQRVDRNDHIMINWMCIPSSRWHNFEMRGTPLGAYDSDSIMHYDSWAFSYRKTAAGAPCWTILKRDGSYIERNVNLSAGDIATINMLY